MHVYTIIKTNQSVQMFSGIGAVIEELGKACVLDRKCNKRSDVLARISACASSHNL